VRLRNPANYTQRTVSPLSVRRCDRHFVCLVVNLGDTGYTDLPSRLPTQSSTLYSNNVTKFFLSMTEKDNFVVNLEDEVVRGSIVVHKGEILPPAPLAAPPPAAPSPSATKAAEEEVTKALTPWQKASREVATVTAGMGSIVALGKFTGPALMSNFFTFGLASLIGYRVVWGVTPAVSALCLFHLWVVVLNGCCL
jgi:NAD(P) transhydrogenase